MANYFPAEGETTTKKKNAPAIMNVLKKVAETAAIPITNLKHTKRKIDPHFTNIPPNNPKPYPERLPR